MSNIIDSILSYILFFCNKTSVDNEPEDTHLIKDKNESNDKNEKNINKIKYIDYSKQILHIKHSPDECVFYCNNCSYSFYTLEFFYSEYDYMPYYMCKNCGTILKIRDNIHIRKLKYKCFLF